MKSLYLRVMSAVLALALLSCSLCSCSRLHKFAYDKETGCYTDNKTGIVYTDAPGCYEPVAIGKEYARWRYDKKSSVVFYEVNGVSTAEWLCEEGKTVFYADGVHLPSLTEMASESVLLCIEEALSMVLTNITDKADIAALTEVWLNGEEVVYTGREPTVNLRIKFTSPTYSWLYYNILYLEYGDGSKVLYDRYSGRCVDAGDVLKVYIDGDENGSTPGGTEAT